MFERVAVTGIGVVSPIGIGLEEYWKSLCSGVSGIGPLTRFDPSGLGSRIAGEVKDFVPEQYINRRKLTFLSRSAQFSIAASKMALNDSGLDATHGEGWSITVGTGVAGFDVLERETTRLSEEGIRKIDPLAIPGGSCASSAAAVAIELGLHGESMTISTACSAGLNALGYAYRQIRSGQSNVAIVGGVETPILPTLVGMLSNGKVLSQRNDDPSRASRPFDRSRDGYVISEGAAFFVLENLEHAMNRGARIYAEIAGCGITGDAFSLLRLYEGGEYLALAIKRALYEARLNPEDVDYIGAHGSSSVVSDIRETLAIKEALGHHASRVWISAVKSMIGMPLGAGGALQMAATVLSMHYGMVHPTINLEEVDPACDLDYVPKTYRERELGAALVNSTGLGGTNACLALRSTKSLTWATNDRSSDPGTGRVPAVCASAGGTPVL